MDSQCQLILDYLKAGGELTPIEALNKFGCFRLAARINDLRKEGHFIDTVWKKRNGKKFARYKMFCEQVSLAI